MYIYIGTNNLNGKAYVGYSKYHPLNRKKGRIKQWKRGDNPNSEFGKAIAEFGFDNFSWEVIHYPNASDQAIRAIERWQQSKRNTLTPHGYNVSHGHIPNDKTREKMSKANKGKKNAARSR